MKNSIKYVPFLILIFIVFSCNTANKKKKVDQNKQRIVQNEQSYKIDSAGVSIKWTAYKFTDKLGVSGTFELFVLKLKNRTGSIETLLQDAEIAINTASVNSENEVRDPKLRASFFKVFHTDTIKSRIIEASIGQGVLELEMNNTLNDVEYDYSFKNDTLFLNTHLDLMQWNGEGAMNSLNKECYELHTGTDGLSKLWPDVDVTIKFPITEVLFSE